MSKLSCTIYPNIKNYIIPTKSWLEPLKEYTKSNPDMSPNSVNIESLLMKQQILVKATKHINTKLIKINYLLKNLPNFVYTYGVFYCDESRLFRNKNKKQNIQYTGEKVNTTNLKIIEDNNNKISSEDMESLQTYGFCLKEGPDDFVTLELMKFYKSSLNKAKKIKNINIYISILAQLVNGQYNAFAYEGFTHNDIHLGNILIDKLKEPKILNYEYGYSEHFKDIISVDCEFILADLDNYYLFNEDSHREFHEFLRENKYFDNSLPLNILQTIEALNQQLNDELNDNLKYKVNKIYDNIKKKHFDDLKKSYIKELKVYTKYLKECDDAQMRCQCSSINKEKKLFYNNTILICDKFIGYYLDKIKIEF